jgi:hypothetical protein
VTRDEPIAPPGRSEHAAPQADSRLRSVFLQHRLIATVGPLPGVPLRTTKMIVEQIVERLLALPGGLEPLMLLQRDERALARGVAAAVVAVVVARAAGWPVASLADLGGAALLAELGEVLGDDTGRAAFHWLLERGSEDFWLRCALVARHVRREAAAPVAASTEPGLGTLAVVRLARAMLDQRPPPADLPPELHALAAAFAG